MSRATRKLPRALLPTRWRIACRAARRNSSTWRAKRKRRSTSTVPNRARRRSPTIACWLGGGVRAGVTIGETDDLGFAPVQDRVHVHDLQATLLHLLGLDHTKLTYRFQGRDFRLTDVHGEVVRKLLA